MLLAVVFLLICYEGPVTGQLSNLLVQETDVVGTHTVTSSGGDLLQLYTAVNDPVNLAISAVNAESAHFTVLFGDGNGQTVCGGGTNAVGMAHTYLSAGQYSLDVFVGDDTSGLAHGIQVYIVEALPAADFYHFTDYPAEVVYQENTTFTVERNTGVSVSNFTNITCSILDNSDIIEAFTLGLSHAGDDPVKVTWLPDDAPVHHIVISCDNFVFKSNNTVQILVHQRLHNIQLQVTNVYREANLNSLTRYVYKVGEEVDFQVSGVGGTLGQHNYTLDFGDGEFQELSLESHNNKTAVFTHIYNESAYFRQSVTVNDSMGTRGTHDLYISDQADPDSGVYVYDIDLHSLLLNSSSNQSVLYADEGAQDTFQIYVNPDTDPARVPLETRCEWTWPGDSANHIHTNFTMATVQQQLVSFQYSVDELNQIVEVKCRTPVGKVSLSSNVTVVKYLSNVTLSVTEGSTVEIDTFATISLAFLGGDFSVDVDILLDGLSVYSGTEKFPAGLFVLPYNFTKQGLQTIKATITDGNTAYSPVFEVDVITRVQGLLLYMNGDTASPLIVVAPNTTVAFSLSVELYPATVSLPVQVTCLVDFDKGKSQNYSVGDMSAGLGNAFTFSHEFTYMRGEAERRVVVNCSNSISTQSLQGEVLVATLLQNVSLTSSQYQVLGNVTTVTVSGSGGELGTHFEFLVPGEDPAVYDSPFSGVFTHDHVFKSPGAYTVTVLVWDLTANFTLSTTFLVQHALTPSHLTYTGLTHAISESDLQHDFSVSLQLIAMETWPPTNVSCEWSLPSMQHSAVLSDEVSVLPVPSYPFTYTFDLAQGNNQTVEVNCSNEVSSHTETRHVWIKRVLQDFSLSVVTSSEQVNLTSQTTETLHTHCEDTQTTATCILPNNKVVFNISAKHGDFGITYDLAALGLQNVSVDTHEDFVVVSDLSGRAPGVWEATITAESDAGLTHTATVSAEIQLSVAPFDGSSIKGPTLVAVPVSGPVTYTLEMPLRSLVNSVLYPPTNTSCQWVNVTGGSIGSPIQVSDASDFTTSSVSVDVTFTETIAMTTEISITCYNLISHLTHTLPVHLTPLLSHLHMDYLPTTHPPPYLAVGESYTFNITGRDGRLETVYEISFGEDTPLVTGTLSEFENFSVAHVFTEPGVYGMRVSVNYTGGIQEYECCTVMVQQPLDHVTLTADNTPGTIPAGLVEFSLTADNVGLNPTNVTCTWSHPDNNNVTTQHVFELGLVKNFTHVLDPSVSPSHMTTSVACGNEVSVTSTSVTYQMVERITGVEVTADRQYAEQGGNISFMMSRQTGTNVTYVLDLGEFTQRVEVGDDLSDVHLNVTFSKQGRHLVNLTASNVVEEVSVTLTPFDHVDIQQILTDLTLTAGNSVDSSIPRHFPSPPANLTLTVQHEPLNPPLTVYFDWDFGDNTSNFGDTPPASWESGYTTTKQYSEDLLGQISVLVRAYNNISELALSVNVSLVEMIGGLSITANLSHSRPGEEVTFTGQVTRGSHLTYSVNFGDSVTETMSYNWTELHRPEVVNREQKFTHIYTEAGDHTVQLVGSNPESSDTVSIVYAVQDPVPDLMLIPVVDPVLCPPGEMVFTVERLDELSYSPSHVTCIWTYSDGSADEVLTYTAGWSINTTTHEHVYNKPAGGSIESVVTVNVSCSNPFTPVPSNSSVTVAVETNPVVLGSLHDNGPVTPGQPISWSLEVESHGHDGCFLWTFTNVSYSVLFGREECKNLPRFTGQFDDFVLSSTSDETLDYTKLFNIAPAVHLHVFAENSVGSVEIDDVALVLQEPCDPPTVGVGAEGINASDPRVVSVTDLISITGTVDTDCSYEHSYDVVWRLHLLGGTVPTLVSTQGLVVSKLDLTIPPHTLDPGQYRLGLTAYMRDLLVPVEVEARMYLHVVPTHLEVQISGGMWRLVSSLHGGTVSLDAYRGATDPSLQTDSKADMSWKWVCTKTQDPDIFVFSTYDWTANTGVDMGNCDVTATITTGVLEWPSELLEEDYSYTFGVQLSKTDGRTDTFTQIIQHTPFNVFDVEIDCVRNCGELVNGRSRLRVSASCLSDVCTPLRPPSYTWSFQILNQITTQYEQIDVQAELVEDTLSVPANTFLEGRTYQIVLSARLDDWRGESAMSYLVNYPPYEGSCVANITEGYAMETQYVITCTQWRDDEEENIISRRKRFLIDSNAPNLLFSVYITLPSGEEMMLSHSRDPVIRGTYLPIGDPDSGFTLPIYVVITDSLGSNTHVDLKIVNQPRVSADPGEQLLTYLVQLKKAADAGDIQTAVQMLWTIRSLEEMGILPTVVEPVTDEILLDLYSGSGVDTTEILEAGITEIQTRGYYILQLSKLQPVSPVELHQVIGALKSVVSNTSDLHPITDTKTGVEIIDDLMSSALVVSEQMTSEDLDEFVSDIVYTTGELLDMASAHAEGLLTAHCNTTSCTDPHVLEDIRQNNKPLVDTAASMLQQAASLSLRDYVFGESPRVFGDQGKVVVTANKVGGTPADLMGLVVETRLGLTRLPFEESVFANVTAECVEAIGLAFERNPYTWHAAATSVQGPVQSVRLLDCVTKTTQPLLNVTEQDDFHMETNFQMTADWTPTVLTDTATQIAYHRFRVNQSDSLVQLFFSPHLQDVTMAMYVSFEGDPNVNSYDFTDVLPRGLPSPAPSDPAERLAAIQNLTAGGPYSYVLPSNLTTRVGEYTVGVVATGYDEAGSRQSVVNYTFYVQFLHCRLWFDQLESWQDAHCKVQESSTPTRVRFKSKVFPSSFGAGLAVAPNTIDFGTVFDDVEAKLLSNIHILVTILLFLAAYFTILPFAVKYDKQDKRNWTPLPIVGFLPSDRYQYMVDVYTGIQSKSGTQSNVYLVLIGSDAETENVQLYTADRKNFQRGTMNRFVVGSKMHLGKITYLHVYHDNSGRGDAADWLLDKVVVLDRQEGKRYLFYCNTWLSLTRGDSSLRRVLRLVSKSELTHNKGMLKRRALANVVEDNLWVSTLFRRNEHHFSRVQRLTTALAVVFLSMVASAIWFGRGDSDTPTDGIQIGPLSFTLRTVIVSVYALLTVLPGTLLILLLFMKSKRRPAKPPAVGRDPPITPPPPYSETLPDNPHAPQVKHPAVLADSHMTLGSNAYSASLSSVNPEIDGESLGGGETVRGTEAWEKEGGSTVGTRGILRKASSRFLPPCCVPLAYLLCLCAVVLSGFFTLLYSFEWGPVKSSRWLTSFCLSFLESEAIISPIKAVLLAVLISLFCKIPTDHSDEFYEDNTDIVFDEEPHDPDLTSGVQSLVYRRHLKAQLMNALKALFWHVMFLTCLVMVTFGNRDPNSYRCNSELRSLYYQPAVHIKNQADLWDYLEDTAVPSLFLRSKYNGDAVTTADRQYTGNTLARRLGPPALRQFRIKPVSCQPVIAYDLSCSEDYKKYKTEDKTSYLPGWRIQVANATGGETHSQILQAFVYDKGDALNYDYYGYFGTYTGRGYTQSLGNTEEEALDRVEQLVESDWLDRYTRAVMLEFNVYNPHVNLFSLVTVMCEFPSMGAALVKSEVTSVKLYRYTGTWGVFNLLSEAIVIVFVIIMIVRLCVHMVREGKAYFSSIWNCVEILKLVCGLGAIAMYVTRTLLIQSTVTYMMNNRDLLVNFRGVTLSDEIFVYLIGLMLFLQILQLAQVFRFNRSLGVLGGTLKHAISDLASFGVVIFIIFMAFLMVNYMYYGRELWDYRNPLQVAYAQVSAMLGHFRANEFEESAGFFGRITFTLFMLTMVFIYINMLVVIIMDVYAEVNSGKLEIGDAHKAVDLLTETLKS